MVVRPRSKRSLTAEERTLWSHVTRHVKPLLESAPNSTEIAADEKHADAEAFARTVITTPTPASSPQERRHRTQTPKQPRQRRDISPQARLDLHGMTEEEAHRALVQFITMSLALRCRRVLIITGKGRAADSSVRSHPSEGRGVLRRLVPLWLEVEMFRPFVAGVMSAPIDFGGPGALVVDLNPRGN
jgi:DNA-nicking Smr family endonuclease